MDRKAWKKRIKYRGDLTSKVTHLTKGKTEVEAFENLVKILEEKCIKGSTRKKGFICGCKCQYKNDQKVENKNVHFPRSIPQLVFP